MPKTVRILKSRRWYKIDVIVEEEIKKNAKNLEDSQKPQETEVVVVLVHPGRCLREVIGEHGQEVDDGVERHHVPETGHARGLLLFLFLFRCKRNKKQ